MRRWTNARTWVALPAAIAVVAALALAGPPASAASDERADKVGDAPRIIDIASFSVRNDNTRAVITSHVPGLKTRGGFAFRYGYSRYGGLIVDARKLRRPTGRRRDVLRRDPLPRRRLPGTARQMVDHQAPGPGDHPAALLPGAAAGAGASSPPPPGRGRTTTTRACSGSPAAERAPTRHHHRARPWRGPAVLAPGEPGSPTRRVGLAGRAEPGPTVPVMLPLDGAILERLRRDARVVPGHGRGVVPGPGRDGRRRSPLRSSTRPWPSRRSTSGSLAPGHYVWRVQDHRRRTVRDVGRSRTVSGFDLAAVRRGPRPPAPTAGRHASRLNVPFLAQRKDTSMLLLEEPNETEPHLLGRPPRPAEQR